ncbi:hypothetical protein OHA35_44300 [Streptomyces sp. NBC_00233]|nr:hypothetical protein [Streptomyces sp. NBC_00233]MCX5233304.1 hypothetical protein [Streptomyces sp. NBC_00233]
MIIIDQDPLSQQTLELRRALLSWRVEGIEGCEARSDRWFVNRAVADSDLDRADERAVGQRSYAQRQREMGRSHARDKGYVAAACGEGDHGGEVGAGVPHLWGEAS